MTPQALSLPDVLVLVALFLGAALAFLLVGWRFGRESAGRAMFEHPLSAAPHESAAADDSDPWDAAMSGRQDMHPASADASQARLMPFFASRGRPDTPAPRGRLPDGG